MSAGPGRSASHADGFPRHPALRWAHPQLFVLLILIVICLQRVGRVLKRHQGERYTQNECIFSLILFFF